MDPAGKVVIVTGASSGIGREVARAFAARRAVVVAVARREERLRALTAELQRSSPDSSFLCGDLGEAPFADSVVAETLRRHGRLDVLVNNAALPSHRHALHLSAGECEAVMRVNFLAAVQLTLAAFPPMLAQRGGTIVNVSSFAAQVAPPREAIYVASKAALNGFTEGLWNDLAGSGIHVALVHTGPIDTEIWEKHDESGGYAGTKHPPQVVVDAIFRAIEERRLEVTAPRRSPTLALARWLKFLAPALVRRGSARLEPVPPALVEAARERARRSLGRD
jgi:short-subunit dehydrogenase